MNTSINKDLTGIASGFRDIDNITSGWQPGDLIMVAGRPNMGKTSFMLSMVLNIAERNVPVAIFSLEMPDRQIVTHLLSNVSEIPIEILTRCSLGQADHEKLTTCSSRLQELPLYIDDTPGLSVKELSNKARRLVHEHGVKIIAIDYLNLMKFNSRESVCPEGLMAITKSLKELAQELKIPIILLCMMSRWTLPERGEKRPKLSDLRRGGDVDKHADIVCFIHRPEYYLNLDYIVEDKDIHGKTEFTIINQHTGQVDTVNLRFNYELVRFENGEPII